MSRLETFESLLRECRSAVERTVFFRISVRADAEDVLQEVYLTAYRRFDTLADRMAFKAWIISIARNKCVDYYRRRAARAEIPMEMLSERVMTYGRCGPREETMVRKTLAQLAQKDQSILKLYYFQELPQAEIAKRLQIPLGTVKSRLHTARENFRELYPKTQRAPNCQVAVKGKGTTKSKYADLENMDNTNKAHRNSAEKESFMGENIENKTKVNGRAVNEATEKGIVSNEKTSTKTTILPESLPDYTITKSQEAPFETVWEELQGWMIVPRLGETLTWGLYELPSRRRTEYTELAVTGRAEVHGIEGVEIVAVQYDAEDYYRTGSVNELERRFVAQLTDTHSRYLAESHMEDGVRKCYTFLDGDSFMNNWGFGEDNCGNEIHVRAKGILRRDGADITYQVDCEKSNDQGIVNSVSEHRATNEFKSGTLDVVGCYTVTIAGKSYDTICVMDVESFDDAIVTESYIDRNGRTVLWRRFNHEEWAIERFGGKKWSEMLPDNEKITVDGSIYVHWYDCISDYIL